MSGIAFHAVALALGLVICADVVAIIWLAVSTGKYGLIAFVGITGLITAYCFGRAALILLGWEA